MDSVVKTKEHNEVRSSIALYGLMLFMAVYIGRIQELFTALWGLKLGKVFVALTVFLYFVSPKKRQKISLSSFPQTKYIFGIIIFAILSILFSSYRRLSFNAVFVVYLKRWLFFYLMVKIINNGRDLIKINKVLVFSAILLAIFVITFKGAGRAAVGVGFDPNDTAYIMVTLIPIVYAMMVREKKIQKLILFIGLALMLYAIIRTRSRMGFVALILVSALIFLKLNKMALIKGGFVFIILLIIFSSLASAVFWERISTIKNLREDYNITSRFGRIQVWTRGIELMLQNPVLGVGAGAFMVAEGLSHSDIGGKWSAAHNSFIEIGAETGIPGLICFIGLIASSLCSLRNMKKRSSASPVLQNNIWLINALEISFYSYIISSLALSLAYSPLLYVLIAYCIILKKLDLEYAMERK